MNFFVTFYSIYTLFQMYFLHQKQGAKLSLKKKYGENAFYEN